MNTNAYCKRQAKEKMQPEQDFFSTDYLKTDLKKRAVRGGSFAIFARSADFMIQLTGTLILARILTPEDFGLIAMVTTVTGFFLIFKDLGLTEATIQSEKLSHDQVSTLFWINVAFSLLICCLVILCAPVIASFYGEPRIKSVTIVTSFSFILAGMLTQHMALLKRKMQFSNIAVIEILAALGSLGITLFLAFKGAGYWALVIRPLSLGLLMCIGVWIACGWRPGKPVRRSGVRSLIKFGANALGYYSINYFARNLDKALIGWKSGAGPLGFYNKAFHLFIIPINQFSMPLHSVAVSSLSKLKNDPVHYKKFYMKALSALSFAAMPMSTFLAAVSHDLILLLLGPQWEPATRIFSILSLSAGIQIMYSTKSWIHVSLGRADRWLRWGIIASIITALFFIAGLPFGTMGIAAGYTASLFLLTIPALLYAGNPVNFTVGYLISGIWKYYVAAVLAGVICWFFAGNLSVNNLFLKLIYCFGAFSFTYLLMLVILYRGISPITQCIALFRQVLPASHKSAG